MSKNARVHELPYPDLPSVFFALYSTWTLRTKRFE